MRVAHRVRGPSSRRCILESIVIIAHETHSSDRDFDDTPDRQGQNEPTVADESDMPISRLSGPSYDPLSKYHEDAMFGHGDESEDEQPPNESSTGLQGRRGYQCLEIGYKLKGPGPNDHIIDIVRLPWP